MSEKKKRRPRELLSDILTELDELFVALEKDGDVVDGSDWANLLMNISTDFLRDLADFRDGVQKAREIYPDEWFEEAASPDLDDPDMSGWHELMDWFVERSLLARSDGVDWDAGDEAPA